MSTSETTAATLLELVAGRRGHFRLESGHHSGLWLDLDPLFAEPRRIAPFVTALTSALRPHAVSAVCGPLLGGAFLAQLVAHALDVEFCFTERVMPAERGGLYRACYRLPSAYAARLRGKRVAVVDDVMSAGSALRGTYAALQSHGATPVVAGALLVLDSTGARYFAEHGVTVEAVAREGHECRSNLFVLTPARNDASRLRRKRLPLPVFRKRSRRYASSAFRQVSKYTSVNGRR